MNFQQRDLATELHEASSRVSSPRFDSHLGPLGQIIYAKYEGGGDAYVGKIRLYLFFEFQRG